MKDEGVEGSYEFYALGSCILTETSQLNLQIDGKVHPFEHVKDRLYLFGQPKHTSKLQSSTLGMFADLGTDRPDFRTHMASCSSSPRGSTYVDPHEKIPPFLLVCVETCAKTGPDPWFNRQVRCGEPVASGRRPDDTDHLSRTRQSCRRHKARGSDRYLESNHEPQCGSIPIKTHIEEHFKKRENTC